MKIEDRIRAKTAAVSTNPDVGLLLDSLPGLVWTAHPDGSAEYVGKGWLDYTGMTFDEAVGGGFMSAVHPDDLDKLLMEWSAILASGQAGELEARLRRHDGRYRWCLFRGRPMPDPSGVVTRWCGMNLDIDDRVRADRTLAAEKRLLEMVAQGSPLRSTLDGLCRHVEELVGADYTSILLVDAESGTFRVGAAPSFPADYRATLEGRVIRESHMPTTRAVVRKAPVIVADVANDPRWAATAVGRRLVASGLLSCWAMPILSGAGDVLGVFAAYHLKPQEPTKDEYELIERFAHVAGIAIERDQAEAALRGREKELSQAHDQLTEAQRLSQTGSFVVNHKRDEHHWSEECFRILELDPSTPVSADLVFRFVVPEDREALETALTDSASGKEIELEDLRVRTASGALKHLRLVVRPSSNFAEEQETFGAVQDVTVAKNAEAALKSSEAALKRAYDSLAEAQRLSHTGSFITDLVANDHDWSEEAYRIFDFDPAAPVSLECIRDIVHPDDVGNFDEMIATAMTGADVAFIFRIVTGKGALKHVYGVARVVERVSGRPLFVGALQDVTASKLVEEALRASEAALTRANRHLMEAQRLSKTGSFTWDVEADEHDWSDEGRRMWEVDPKTRITLPMILAAVHPDDMPLAEAVIGRAARAAAGFDLTFRIITKSGAVKHMHCVGSRQEQASDRLVYEGAIQDITERKAAEDALRESEAELTRVMRLTTIGELVASITHEITQPLTAVAANGRASLNWLGRDTPDVDRARKALQRIDHDVQHAGDVIRSLRALVTKSGPNRAWVSVERLVDEVLVLVGNQLRNRDVRVVTDLSGDVAPIFADRVQLQQVILNLVMNGAEAMDGIVPPRVLTIASSPAAEGGIYVSVADTGPGMDADTAERVFDSFFTTKSSGMGMGLSICRSIINAHGGRIWVEPNAPHGAIFQFTVPRGSEALDGGR
jgi:PAS domain S-box-containing protein